MSSGSHPGNDDRSQCLVQVDPEDVPYARPRLLLKLRKTLVLSRLDYCSQLWNPHRAVHIQALQEVQPKLFTSLLEHIKKLSVMFADVFKRSFDRFPTVPTSPPGP